MTRAWLSWSSGKDSTLALDVARREGVEVVGLLTTVQESGGRVAMHEVRRELLDAQADALGLPLHVVSLPWPASNEAYESRMRAAVDAALGDGAQAVVFGDLYLADVRAYRERQLAGTGLEAVFPLWGRPTGEVAREIVDRGVRATLTCVDPAQLDPSFAGRDFDDALLADLPPGADPCGENGEFHTFVRDGPGFAHPVPVVPGEVARHGDFVHADLLPGR